MELFLGNESVFIPDSELSDRYIGEGSEGTLYQYGKEAIKIYNEDYSGKRLSEEEALKLSKIKTKRILLPRRLVYNKEKKYVGHTSDFKIEYNKGFICRLTMEQFLDNLEKLRDDTKTISKKGIIFDDLHQDNVIVSDEIYLCDPNMYRFGNEEDSEKIYRNNIQDINYLFTKDILKNHLELTKKQAQVLENYLSTSSDLFTKKLEEEQDINYKQKVKPYFKKLAMKLM